MKIHSEVSQQEGMRLRKNTSQQGFMLAAIVNSSDDAIVSKDLNGIVTSWNRSAQKMFGYLAEEMIGQPILKLIPPDRKHEEVEILAKLRKGGHVDHFETKRVTKSGTIIDVSLTISPVRNGRGKIIGLSKIARDITEKKLEQQRKNDFVAMVSHELKTPLTSIKSYIQLLLRQAKKTEDHYGTNALSKVDEQVKKMTTMIRDFLDLSRLEEGKMPLNKSQFSVQQFMDEIVSEAKILLAEHNIRYNSCNDAILNADRDKLQQVMANLLSNAAKYSSKGSTITVLCEQVRQKVKFSVIDEGIGIDTEDQKRLFERFYRVGGEQTKNISGFGIGLYLCSEILRLHNSIITVESLPGSGSTFSFSMDIVDNNL
ncbi:PAS domain-containing sensor histidine kinase [Pedobacter punctiformis]|uniref:histidine kinase n=1 Tax=Pedobacter punctiformis TaxID=3004097 RepID=A0ABT4LDD5_9SPHI|nr:PAS domain S-box protein [Pedobacter sp. HCMS5-2]MCZ4245925.1 PAS domain S-box protein [Pedobacter sp. HCMS5-2]